MAKKKPTARRVPKSGSPRMYGDGKSTVAAQPAAPVAGSPVRPAVVPRPGVPPRQGTVATMRMQAMFGKPGIPLSQEYRYVIGDLRRLGILAVSTFILLGLLRLLIR